MRLHHQHVDRSGLFIIGVLISYATFFAQPSKAFIPYVYSPTSENLQRTGISIGKTAAQLLQLGQFKEAIRLGALAVRLQPNDDRLWSILAEAQLKNQNIKDAKYSLAKAKKLNPQKASLWFAEASLKLQEKKPKDAVLLINKGLKLEPDNAGAYFQLGNAWIMQKKFQVALKSFKKAIKLKPAFWEALNNEGIVLFEMGKVKEAIHTWRKVLKIQLNAEPMLALAAALYQLGPLNQEILRLANQALSENPNYVSSKHQQEQLWGLKLQQATKELLSNPELLSGVNRALANSDSNP